MDLKQLFSNLKSIDRFRDFFGTEEACLNAIAADKWKNGYVCRKCGNTRFCDGKSKYSRRCTRCKSDESATANTVFHHCRIPITEAFELAYRICCSPGVSTYELSREMNTRQMTCWKFKKKIQDYLVQKNSITKELN